MSFAPFLSGKRACLGRTLGENMANLVFAMIIWKYDIELVDKSIYEKKPSIDM
jgi:cytochrome P450